MLFRYLSWILPLGLASCTVYAPTQPYVPQLTTRGQAEVLVQSQLLVRPELTVSYSPLPHLLVAGGGVWRPALFGSSNDNRADDYRTLQGWGGLGTYASLAPGWHLHVLVGAGLARAERTVSDGGFLLSYGAFYEAHYTTQFAQATVCHQAPNLVWGVGYRLTQVSFQELAVSDHDFGPSTNPLIRYALPPGGQLRHEPFVFYRSPLGGNQRRWQLQGSVAYSFCRPGQATHFNPQDKTAYRVGFNRGGGLLIGFGVTYQLGQTSQ